MGTPLSPLEEERARSSPVAGADTLSHPVLLDFTRIVRGGEDDATGTFTGEARLPNSPPGYDLLRYLGGGGMGDVYLAREHTAERIVAMKFLRGAPHSSAAERFVTEVRSLAKFDHPNIIRVISVDGLNDQAHPFFTMEYASGGTLNDRIKAKGPFAPLEAARIVAEVTRAVEVAHGEQILHRDLKPSNIVFGKNDTPKVTDFGLAKRTDLEEGLSMSTGPLGTPAYMPPEQISKRHGKLCPASDVYGLGATLYHLLTGRPPFQGDSQQDICTKVVKDQPERVQSLRPDVPRELEGIVVKCLEKSSAQRYASASALADDLDRFMSGQTPVAPPMTRLRRMWRWVGRNRTQLVTTVPVLAAFVGMGFLLIPPFSTVKKNDPPQQADPLVAIRENLVAGRSVKIVDRTGPPNWYLWRLGGSAIGESPQNDQSAYFQTRSATLLELLQDPGIDRYRLSFDIRQVDGDPPPPGGPLSPSYVGVFFGYTTTPAADGWLANTLFAVRFTDLAPIAVPNLAPNSVHSIVQFGDALYAQHPTRSPTLSWNGTGGTIYSAKKNSWPGEWRRIVLEVSPARVAAYWVHRGFLPYPEKIYEMTGDETQARYSKTGLGMEKHLPGSQIVPQWSPRMSLGILACRAGVSFRNVTIDPLPPPP